MSKVKWLSNLTKMLGLLAVCIVFTFAVSSCSEEGKGILTPFAGNQDSYIEDVSSSGTKKGGESLQAMYEYSCPVGGVKESSAGPGSWAITVLNQGSSSFTVRFTVTNSGGGYTYEERSIAPNGYWTKTGSNYVFVSVGSGAYISSSIPLTWK